jgi:hypothetical protein
MLRRLQDEINTLRRVTSLSNALSMLMAMSTHRSLCVCARARARALSAENVHGLFKINRHWIYVDMSVNFLLPLIRNGDLNWRLIFQQDGAPPSFLRKVTDCLDQHFRDWPTDGAAAIHWPPRSPVLTPMDCCLLCSVKFKSISYHHQGMCINWRSGSPLLQHKSPLKPSERKYVVEFRRNVCWIKSGVRIANLLPTKIFKCMSLVWCSVFLHFWKHT